MPGGKSGCRRRLNTPIPLSDGQSEGPPDRPFFFDSEVVLVDAENVHDQIDGVAVVT